MGKNSIVLSVIIPVYNVEKYLEECLESVISQTIDDMQIICINDGSEDSSLQILERYSKKENRLSVFSQKNKGVSAARNRGLQEATGKYIYFIDSDDSLKAGALSTIVEKMEANQLDVLQFSGESVYESEKLKEQYTSFDDYYMIKNSYNKVYKGPELVTSLCKNGDYRTSICLKCFRKDFLMEHGLIFEEGVIYEDNGFSYKALMLSERVMQIGDALYNRRVRDESIVTKEISYKNFYGYFRAFIDMNQFIEEKQTALSLNEYNCKPFRGAWGNAVSLFIKLSEEEQEKIRFLSEKEMFFYQTHFESAIRYRKELKQKEKKINEYKSIVDEKNKQIEKGKQQLKECKESFESEVTELEAEKKKIKSQYIQMEEKLNDIVRKQNNEIDELNKNEKKLRRKIRRQKNMIKGLQEQVDSISSSFSYRIGHVITFLPRKIKKMIK